MRAKELIWPLLGIAFTGAPLVLVGFAFSAPERSEWPRALWETVLLSGAGFLAGYAILRFGARRWTRVVALLTVPLATFLYVLLDYEGGDIELSRAMAPEGKRLTAVTYPDNPFRTALAWYFLNIPFARSLVFLVIPAVPVAVVGVLRAFIPRPRQSASQRSRSTSGSDIVACEECGCSMRLLTGSGPGFLMLERSEFTGNIGPAERCKVCGRVWCASCYPARAKNTCPCGRDRHVVETIGGATYTGPIRLVKVQYT